MKAFFHRLHLGGSKDKDRDNTQQKEKFPPLPSWPPQQAQRPTSTATLTAFKPLPEIVPAQIASHFSPRGPTTDVDPLQLSESLSTSVFSAPKVAATSSQSDDTAQGSSITTTNTTVATASEGAGRSSRKTPSTGTNGAPDVQKKVAFISPPPTPANFDQPLPPEIANSTTPIQPPGPLKTNVSRFQATYGKEPRGSGSTAASSSKTDVATPSNKIAVKSTSTRTASPYAQKVFEGPSAQSLRSGTPYSAMSTNTSGSRILAATSWSEVTEDDLVSNIGSRERTRQEVLFEIIQSEERYVQELVKMKDTFIDPLLHPYSTLTAASNMTADYDYYRADSPFESADDLPPIAARFMSPILSLNPPQSTTSLRMRDALNIDGESADTDDEEETYDRAGKLLDSSRRPRDNHPRSPYRSTITRTSGRSNTAGAVPFPSRSHASLPAPRNPLTSSTHSLGRQSAIAEQEREHDRDRDRKFSQGNESPNKGMLRKFRKSQATPVDVLGNTIGPHQLPEDLRICLEVIDGGVFDGHKRLSEALKKRYDDQFPLVRSLADVFVSNSDIFKGYATYVLHLERALEQVDAALSNVSAKKPKKQDAGEWQKVCKLLQQLEESAGEKGETGLAITLSKPFQRLLKYPLLFQNLLFHTDPSTFEYESTLQMVAEVENIVRSIEDEKIQKEERDRTRDIFARIEGLDKVRELALPKSSRILVDERPCNVVNGSSKLSSPPPVINTKGVRTKSSFKRLSDVLRPDGFGGKKDLWLVVFNDVVLQCQRTGSTSLPIVSSTASRTNSLPELQGKTKYASLGRRNSTAKPRNLYKFIKIENWDFANTGQPPEAVVSMEVIAKTRVQALSSQPRIVPMPADDERGSDSDDSDKKSKMSFSYWGADKITVQKPVIKGRTTPGATTRRAPMQASYGRESSANAKFGTRLVSDGSSTRPASRRTQASTPSSRRPTTSGTSEESPNYARATITRPAWDASTRSPLIPKRQRNTSQPSAASTVTKTPLPQTPASAGAKSHMGSLAPSEDSGVGLYRQMLANDPTLNNSA